MSRLVWQGTQVALCIACLVGFVGGCCVSEGTSIATPAGNRRIESLVPGDEVLSVSPEGKTETGVVTRSHKSTVLSRCRITLADGTHLRVAGWHPLATRTGWVSAARLTVGQELQTTQGWQAIAAMDTDWGLVNVYDLTVSPQGTFIADGVVVHNMSIAAPIPPARLPGVWIGGIASREEPSRLVLYADGTGVFAWCRQVYRITQWTTKTSSRSPYYRLEGTISSFDKARSDGILSGTVGPSGIDLHVDLGREGGFKCYLCREEHVEQTMKELKDLMKPYQRPDAHSAAPLATQESVQAVDRERVATIAKQAVEANDTWADRATYEVEQTEHGWSVMVWREPRVPGGHRLILIDKKGKVLKYYRGE